MYNKHTCAIYSNSDSIQWYVLGVLQFKKNVKDYHYYIFNTCYILFIHKWVFDRTFTWILLILMYENCELESFNSMNHSVLKLIICE